MMLKNLGMSCGKYGEMPIEHRDSWFSPKCIEVQRIVLSYGGRALNGLGGLPAYRTQPNSECHMISGAVRLRAIRSVVKRETAQIDS